MKNLFDIKDKVIIVTGGCGILGKSIANYLAEQGAKIVILDRVEEIANERHNFAEEEHAVFLSGNKPLVDVLREALIRDESSRKNISKQNEIKKVLAYMQILSTH